MAADKVARDKNTCLAQFLPPLLLLKPPSGQNLLLSPIRLTCLFYAWLRLGKPIWSFTCRFIMARATIIITIIIITTMIIMVNIITVWKQSLLLILIWPLTQPEKKEANIAFLNFSSIHHSLVIINPTWVIIMITSKKNAVTIFRATRRGKSDLPLIHGSLEHIWDDANISNVANNVTIT